VPRSAHTLSYSPVLRVDPERVEGLVRRLEGVIREVALVEASLKAVGAVDAPGADHVSRNASAQAAKMVEGASSYLARWREQLVLAADAMRSQRTAYLAADKAERA
jgi:hypothetical protein